jgi:membrane associated rhomboid family serine protease
MGIENRDYLKDEERRYSGGGFGSQFSGKSMVVRLIAATVAVFMLQLLMADGRGLSPVTDWLSLEWPPLFRQGQVWRLLTYAFCHSEQSLLHIVFNMYLLYMIGTIVCSLTGDREFLFFYLAAAIFSGICSIAFYLLMGINATIIGASGAVMAVFMLFAMHYPRQQMLIMGVIPIEVRWLLVLYIIFDGWPVVSMLMGGRQESAVAHSAHLGGLLFGFLYFRWHMRLSAWWDNFAGRLPSPRRSRKNLKVFNPGTQPTVDMSEKVDEILAKISREGEASLTPRERKILTQASQNLRRGRE